MYHFNTRSRSRVSLNAQHYNEIQITETLSYAQRSPRSALNRSPAQLGKPTFTRPNGVSSGPQKVSNFYDFSWILLVISHSRFFRMQNSGRHLRIMILYRSLRSYSTNEHLKINNQRFVYFSG